MPLSKHQMIRNAVMDYIEDKRSRGGVWDVLRLPKLMNITRLTDARFLQIEDGLKGKLVTWVRGSNASVTPGQPDGEEALISLFEGLDPQARLILFTPFALTPADAAANAATLLHELVHHAEYRAGLLGVPGAKGNPSVQERNTDYLAAALDAVFRLETLRSHFETDFPTASDEKLTDYIRSFARALQDIRLLERGRAVTHHENRDGPHGLAIRPDLNFLKRDLNIDLSAATITKYFVSGRAGPVLQVVFRDILPVIQTMVLTDEGTLILQYEEQVRRFASAHNLDAKELAERLANAEQQARADYAKYQKDFQRLLSEMLETHLRPILK